MEKEMAKVWIIVLLLSLLVRPTQGESRTCSETDGYIACNSALCFFDEFESCRVLCTEGCSFAVFSESLVECLGSVGCSRATFQRSTAVCQNCVSATFYFSAVTCETSAACSGVNWASGNCCDGIGCPSTMPSCEGDVTELCSTTVLDFTVMEGGNPVCTYVEQAATMQPIQTPAFSPSGAPVPSPSELPTPRPSSPPVAAPPGVLQIVQDTKTGIQVRLRGVEMPGANDILSFESIANAWFEGYYAASAAATGIENFRTTISVTSQQTKTETALISSELRFKQQVRYTTKNGELDMVDVVTAPFWDDTANADLVNRLRQSGGSFSSLQGPIGVPEFSNADSVPRQDPSENEASTQVSSVYDQPAPSGIYVALVVLGVVLVLIVAAIIVFFLCKTMKKRQKNKGTNGPIEEQADEHRTPSSAGECLTSQAQPSNYSTTIATSTASNRSEDPPHANVVGIHSAAKNSPGLTYKCQTRNADPDIATAEAIPVRSVEP